MNHLCSYVHYLFFQVKSIIVLGLYYHHLFTFLSPLKWINTTRFPIWIQLCYDLMSLLLILHYLISFLSHSNWIITTRFKILILCFPFLSHSNWIFTPRFKILIICFLSKHFWISLRVRYLLKHSHQVNVLWLMHDQYFL